jgi:hypothetical protein
MNLATALSKRMFMKEDRKKDTYRIGLFSLHASPNALDFILGKGAKFEMMWPLNIFYFLLQCSLLNFSPAPTPTPLK